MSLTLQSDVDHRVRAVFAGLPQIHTDAKGTWETALYKRSLEEPTWVGWDNLAGDRQADLVNHGGKDKAVCVYPLVHYRGWSQKFGVELRPGAFGENFSVDLVESQICLGDIFQIGALRVEVAQPRRPCWKVCRRWGIPELAREMLLTGRTGWYLRVLEPGYVWPGASAVLAERRYPQWTVAKAHHIRYNSDEPEQFLALATCSALPDGWRSKLTRKAELACTR